MAQSGLRHALALEKLINSNDSRDTALKNLRDMVQSGENSVYNVTSDSFR